MERFAVACVQQFPHNKGVSLAHDGTCIRIVLFMPTGQPKQFGELHFRPLSVLDSKSGIWP
jgi:hypothetical protein